ncbi:hypothetical protein ACFO3O_01055 [Dokdonia ponticola]|uniref:Asparagine synthetase domain-containing protein n=1 Tax=Dokdonia ponticola TaxID=2041041 RepID=A0ABV9HSK1_9FLAO
MKKKQYFITNDPSIHLTSEEGFSNHTIDDYTVFCHEDLECTLSRNNVTQKSMQRVTLSLSKCDVEARKQNGTVTILGFIIDPNQPEAANQDIADTLAKSTSTTHLFKALELLTGKFALFYTSETHTMLLTDFFSERQLYYWKRDDYYYISSSDKLILDVLQLSPEISTEKKTLVDDPLFLNINEHWLLSEEDWDERIKKLIPNQYLDIRKNKTERLPIFVSNQLEEAEVLTAFKTYLQNVMKAITLRYTSIYFPITAGYDSRLLLAASIQWKDNMKFYIFNSGKTYVLRDVKIAKQIAKKFHLDFEEIKVPDMSPAFKKEFASHFIVPRFLSKTRNIAWFKEHITTPTVNISGGGGNLKGVYDEAAFTTIDDICKAIEYENIPIHKKALEKWRVEARPYAEQYNIPLNDLFFQELRMAKWAAKMYHEADITAVDYYSPLNSRHIMYMAFLNIPAERRHKPASILFKTLTEDMLPGATQIPYNPKTWRDYIKSIIPYQRIKKQVRLVRYGNKL